MRTLRSGRTIAPLLLIAGLVTVVVLAVVRVASGETDSQRREAVGGESRETRPPGTELTETPVPEGDMSLLPDAGAATPLADDRVAQAEDAALAVVRATGDVAQAGFIARRELVESFTTDDFGPAFASETGRQIDTLTMELGTRGVERNELVVHEQPVTVASDATIDGVRVRMWSVMILAAPGLGPARQVWRTLTLDMVEVDGRWLLDGWESEIGPTPAPPAEGIVDTAESVADVLGWRRVDAEG
jgi:hypothetical protein